MQPVTNHIQSTGPQGGPDPIIKLLGDARVERADPALFTPSVTAFGTLVIWLMPLVDLGVVQMPQYRVHRRTGN